MLMENVSIAGRLFLSPIMKRANGVRGSLIIVFRRRPVDRIVHRTAKPCVLIAIRKLIHTERNYDGTDRPRHYIGEGGIC